MMYIIRQMDQRHTHHQYFKYYIGFPGGMAHNEGPLMFCRAQQWFTNAYGWSAEVRMYRKIHDWYTNYVAAKKWSIAAPAGQDSIPVECNPLWSWTNGIDGEYRIYVATQQELTLFCLAHPVDQKNH